KTSALTHCLVNVLLLEVANRNAGGDTAEIPLWLVDGLTAYIQSYNLPTFLVEPNTEMVGNRVKLAGMDGVRDRLANQTPLTFEELSWPDMAHLAGADREYYRDCGQLFVSELLRLNGGKNSLGTMLYDLPSH